MPRTRCGPARSWFAGTDAAIGMNHLPGLDFQRITVREGREWTEA
jgi:hypothetical protein